MKKKKINLWVPASLMLIVVLSILTDSSIIQIIAAVCGVIYVFSTAVENRYGQLFGIVNSALYGYILFGNGVYGTAVYDFLYCIPMQIYTFFSWGKDKAGKEKTEISRCSKVTRILLILITTLVVLVYCIVATKFNFNFALVDGISIILGFIGLYMTSKKKIEQWYCFIISNIGMIGMWSIECIENISNLPMLLMWLVYLVNNTYGLISWTKKLKNKEAESI